MKLRIALVVLSLLLSLLMGLALSLGKRSPAAASAENGGQIVIGLSMDTLKEARWQKDRDLFVARAESLGAKVLEIGRAHV